MFVIIFFPVCSFCPLVSVLSRCWLDDRRASGMWKVCFDSSQQEAQLPLREPGVSYVLSSHHNATQCESGFFELSYTSHVGLFSKPIWQQVHASLPE